MQNSERNPVRVEWSGVSLLYKSHVLGLFKESREGVFTRIAVKNEYCIVAIYKTEKTGDMPMPYAGSEYKRIGVLGGTFDPVHYGHLSTAAAVYYELELDRLYFIPAYMPPHKEREITDARRRLEMTKLAVSENPGFAVLDAEIARGGKSYTIDTVNGLKEAHPCAKLYFIIGADMVRGLEKWKSWNELNRQCVFVAVSRPSYNDSEVMEEIRRLNASGADIVFFKLPGADVSSTEIRERIKKGKPVSYLMPRAVEKYIVDNGLYRLQTAAENLIIEKYPEINAGIKKRLSPKRYRHTLGAADAALRLAGRYNCDKDKVLLAALVHDCAKCYNNKELISMADRFGIRDVNKSAELLHAPVGAVIAEKEYGITDKDVLSAVGCHTEGRPGMSLLEKLIFVADIIEPYRDGISEREYIENTAFEDIDAALVMCLNVKIDYTISKGAEVTGRSYEVLDYYRNLSKR